MYQANIQQRAIGTGMRGFHRRRVDPIAAVKAGLLAGAAVFALWQFFGIVVYDESPWRLVRMIAALVRGPDALDPDDEFDAALTLIALVLFFALSALYALALAAIVSEAPRSKSAIVGLAFGMALYCANFQGFTTLYPWFVSHRTVDTLAVHAVYGLFVARLYWLFRARPRLAA